MSESYENPVDRLKEALRECGVEGFSEHSDDALADYAASNQSDRWRAQVEIRRRAALAGEPATPEPDPRIAELEGLLRETRMYALGSDCSTRALMERFINV
jgi:hypothetical protein